MGPAGTDGQCSGLWADAKAATCPNLKDSPPRPPMTQAKRPDSVYLLSKDMTQVVLRGSGPPETL